MRGEHGKLRREKTGSIKKSAKRKRRERGRGKVREIWDKDTKKSYESKDFLVHI